MTTKQVNLKLIQDLGDYIAFWLGHPKAFVLGTLALVVFVALASLGSLLFWMPKFSPAFESRQTIEEELRVARTGIQTMKSMVGDENVWAQVIQSEYDKIFPSQISKTEQIDSGFVKEIIRPN